MWIAGSTTTAPSAAVDRLEEAGIGDLLVEAGVLEWSGSRPEIVERLPVALARRSSATLVVAGSWPAEVDREVAVAALADGLERLRLAAEARRYFAVGFHLDLLDVSDIESYGAALRELASRLGRDYLLSATLDRRWLDDDRAAVVAGSADFTIAFLYGQRPGEPEESEAWDFHVLERRLRQMEELERPYLLGIVTLGRAIHLDRNERPIEESADVALKTLVWHQGLELEHGFMLEGIDRQVYTFRAQLPTVVGQWRLAAGDRVRIIGTATSYLEELYRLLGVWNLPNMLGQAFFRLPHENETLALGAAHLLNAIGPTPAAPEPVVSIEPAGTSRRGYLIRVHLSNRSAESTDLAFVDYNFVQLTAAGGSFGDVNAGGFRRFDLLAPTSRGELERTLNNPTVLQLFIPLLEGEGRYSSGPVEVRPHQRAIPQVTVQARFLIPGGRDAAFGPVRVPVAGGGG